MILYVLNRDTPSDICYYIKEFLDIAIPATSEVNCKNTHDKLINLLLSRSDLDINIISNNCKDKKNDGYNALTRLISLGYISMLKKILNDKSLKINQNDFKPKSNALYQAILYDRYDIIELLINRNDINLNCLESINLLFNKIDYNFNAINTKMNKLKSLLKGSSMYENFIKSLKNKENLEVTEKKLYHILKINEKKI